jgi:hypothetical protein
MIKRAQEVHQILQRHIADYGMPKGQGGAQTTSSRHIIYDVEPEHIPLELRRGPMHSIELSHPMYQYVPASQLEVSDVPDVILSRNQAITKDFDLRFPTSGPRIYNGASPSSLSRETALYLPGVTPSEYMRRERDARGVETGKHAEPVREANNNIQKIDYIGGNYGEVRLFSHEKGDAATLCDVEDWLSKVTFPKRTQCWPTARHV